MKNKSSKTRQEIANEYDFSTVTLWRKLKRNNIQLPPGLISPKFQKKIYDVLGYPIGISKGDFEN